METAFSQQRPLKSHLVVYDHHVVAVRTQPGVHGLADAADLVQGRSVVVRPAKVQHLGEERDSQLRFRIDGQYNTWEGKQVSFTFGLSSLMS